MIKKEKIIDSFIIFLKGICMGAADIVPGVSGGTIALIMGIYARLIDGIKGFFETFNKKTFMYLFKGNFRKFLKNVMKIDFTLFIPLLFGIGTAILTMSNLINYVMENHRLSTYSVFFGLILGSSYILYRSTRKIKSNIGNKKTFFKKNIHFVSLILGIGLSILITMVSSTNIRPTNISLFFVGSISITAMILPGISGAFILVILNHYEYVISIIRNLQLFEMGIFSLGALTGLFLFSKGISFMLHNHEKSSKLFLIGLMLGSLNFQFNVIKEFGIGINTFILSGSFILLGIFVVYFLEKISLLNKEKI